MPTRAWVSANTARSEAIRKSHASAISSPPVKVAPFTAPITGLRSATMAFMQFILSNRPK